MIDFPNVPIKAMDMTLSNAVSASSSPFTFAQQVYVHQGVIWQATLTLPPLKRDEAKAVEGFLAGLRGASGTFKVGNPLHNTLAVGSITGSVGDTTVTATMTNAMVGDYFEFADHLYIITSINGSNYGIMPPLRDNASNATVDFTYPECVWRLATSDIGWSIDNAGIYSFTIPMVEAI